MNNQDNIRKDIIKIKEDNTLTESEKNSKIQNLLYNNKNNNNNKNIFEEDNNCNHYPNKLCNKFYFSCCNLFYNCIRCHNESILNEHLPIPEAINCSICNLIQPSSNECMNEDCKTIFDKSYCKKCFIWTSKDIYHCNKCELCRLGTEESIYHCDNCDICFNIESKDFHKCSKISYKEQLCAYCIDSIHSSQIAPITLNCGHIVHQKCMNDAIKLNEYKCPNCRKSICNVDWTLLKYLIESQPMPLEEIYENDIVEYFNQKIIITNINNIIKIDYNNIIYEGYFEKTPYVKGYFNKKSLYKPPKMKDIYCNDCDKKSNVKFHYLGHECKECGSFNTQ
jgi:RING finger/CHY zinc finger protein 1